MSIPSRLNSLRKQIPAHVTLIAVSKFHARNEMLEAYDAGQRVFGESRVQELVEKQSALPPDIDWHFIGTLQRNKVKYIAPFVQLIHSLDSERLMREIDKQAANNNRIISCLLQLHIAEEETKSGFSYDECHALLESQVWKRYPHVQLCGVMGMATFTDDARQVCKEFRALRAFFDDVKKKYFAEKPEFKEISMGMSGDFGIAIKEGSTMVRIGTSIFGER